MVSPTSRSANKPYGIISENINDAIEQGLVNIQNTSICSIDVTNYIRVLNELFKSETTGYPPMMLNILIIENIILEVSHLWYQNELYGNETDYFENYDSFIALFDTDIGQSPNLGPDRREYVEVLNMNAQIIIDLLHNISNMLKSLANRYRAYFMYSWTYHGDEDKGDYIVQIQVMGMDEDIINLIS